MSVDERILPFLDWARKEGLTEEEIYRLKEVLELGPKRLIRRLQKIDDDCTRARRKINEAWDTYSRAARHFQRSLRSVLERQDKVMQEWIEDDYRDVTGSASRIAHEANDALTDIQTTLNTP